MRSGIWFVKPNSVLQILRRIESKKARSVSTDLALSFSGRLQELPRKTEPVLGRIQDVDDVV